MLPLPYLQYSGGINIMVTWGERSTYRAPRHQESRLHGNSHEMSCPARKNAPGPTIIHGWMNEQSPAPPASNRIRMKRVRKDKGHIPPQPLRSPHLQFIHPTHLSHSSQAAPPPPPLRLSAQFWFRALSQSSPATVTRSRSRQLQHFYRAPKQASKGSKRARASCFVTLIPRFRFDFRSGTCEITSRFFWLLSFPFGATIATRGRCGSTGTRDWAS
jgi:hypothetical protein